MAELDRLVASRIIQEVVGRVAGVGTAYVVRADGRTLTSGTSANNSESAFFRTARTLAQATAAAARDIPELAAGQVLDCFVGNVAGPQPEGAAICILDPDVKGDVVLGAVSLVGLPATHAYALLRGAVITNGFRVADVEYPGDE